MSSIMRWRNGLMLGFWVSMACSCQKSRRDRLASNIGSCLPMQTTLVVEHPTTVEYHLYRFSPWPIIRRPRSMPPLATLYSFSKNARQAGRFHEPIEFSTLIVRNNRYSPGERPRSEEHT